MRSSVHDFVGDAQTEVYLPHWHSTDGKESVNRNSHKFLTEKNDILLKFNSK